MATHIMPLGDSITEGQSDSLNYRVRLSSDLSGGGYSAVFAGSMSTNTGNCPTGYKNHEGHSGWCTSDAGGICQQGNASWDPQRPIGINDHITSWLASN